MKSRCRLEMMLMGLSVMIGAGACGCDSPTAGRNDLSAMSKAGLTISDHAFEVWLAREPTEITQGLMQVSEDELAPTDDGAQRGMFFVFDHEQHLGFWMFNTITALDIAYIRSDGTIVKIHTMKPLDTSTYPSVDLAQYALEVRAGTFRDLGIYEGDRVSLPEGI